MASGKTVIFVLAAPSRARPTLDGQATNATKVPKVLGHERSFERHGMRRDSDIEVVDSQTPLLEVGLQIAERLTHLVVS
jgi:hypothetical protein